LTADPIIFGGLKALTLQDPQQASLLKLCAKGIGVYSPHTSVDGAVGGVNDWLASGLANGEYDDDLPIVSVPGVVGILAR
jgi:putative NIF3 family GTP cyclohydrolase 1 type 2